MRLPPEFKTNPVGNVGIVNLEQKKKPHNVNIRNHNPSEPKTQPNTKYSAKQNFRRYKTRTEPNLFSKIQVNEDDDIVSKIQEALGIKPEGKKSNFSEVETSSVPFYKGVDDLPVEQHIADRREPTARRERKVISELLNEITDVTREDISELLGSSSEYHFDTEFTPEKRTSRRERELSEIDFERFPEENPLMMAVSTPTEKALKNRWSSQLTPPQMAPRTPEEVRLAKAKVDADQFIFKDGIADLSFKVLGKLSEEFVTKRGPGRPSGAYGPYKTKKTDNPAGELISGRGDFF
jgi:hypothetical protein